MVKMPKFFTAYVSFFIFLLSIRNAIGEDYDSLQLVLRWPVSFCTDRNNPHSCKTMLPHRFKIHGLRHYNSLTGDFILYCGGHGVWLEESQIPSNLRVKLNREWANLKTESSNLDFWSYQWKKHGTCSGKTVEDYFQLVIDLHLKYAELVDTLKSFGECTPGEKPSCKLTEVINSIEAQFGQTPRFRCNRNYEGVMQLFEITFCFDKSGNPRNCIFSAGDCNQTPFILLPSVKTLREWLDHHEL